MKISEIIAIFTAGTIIQNCFQSIVVSAHFAKKKKRSPSIFMLVTFERLEIYITLFSMKCS